MSHATALEHKSKFSAFLLLFALLLPVSGWSTDEAAWTLPPAEVSEVATQCMAFRLTAGLGREDLIQKLYDSNSAAAVRIHPDGSEIPIILMNSETIKDPVVAHLAKNSLGFMMDVNKKMSEADHGAFRVGDRLVDYGAENDRWNRGEFNQTGLLHRDMNDYFQFRVKSAQKGRQSRTYIELVFPATPEQLETAMYYHNMRRAAVVRTLMESTLKDPKRAHSIQYYRSKPHTLSDCSAENCVTYGTGTRLGAKISEIDGRISNLLGGYTDPQAFIQKPEVQLYIAAARKELIDADWRDYTKVHQQMLDLPYLWQIVEPVLPAWAKQPENHDRAYELMSMVVARDASAKYQNLVHNLGADVFIGRDTDPYDHRQRAYSDKKPELDSQNPMATALFVWADGEHPDWLIRQGRYEYRGANYGIYTSERSPSGFRQVPLSSVIQHKLPANSTEAK